MSMESQCLISTMTRLERERERKTKMKQSWQQTQISWDLGDSNSANIHHRLEVFQMLKIQINHTHMYVHAGTNGTNRCKNKQIGIMMWMAECGFGITSISSNNSNNCSTLLKRAQTNEQNLVDLLCMRTMMSSTWFHLLLLLLLQSTELTTKTTKFGKKVMTCVFVSSFLVSVWFFCPHVWNQCVDSAAILTHTSRKKKKLERNENLHILFIVAIAISTIKHKSHCIAHFIDLVLIRSQNRYCLFVVEHHRKTPTINTHKRLQINDEL